jgi:hypothetical protein
MDTFDNAEKARRIAENAHDIAEIQKVINDYKQSGKIDRQKAKEIIERLNSKDLVIAGFNSPLNPEWILFQNATDEQIANNLNITLLYLSGKMTAEGINDLIKGANSNADA